MSDAEHWDAIYGRKGAGDVSWYRPHLERSIRFVELARLSHDAAIIDVGGGASTFVDDLLNLGYRKVTVLDLSETAMALARQRLGPRADRVDWIVADITNADLPEHVFDFWHDRAVFHFLTDEEARRRYVSAVRRAVKPGGHVVVATFGPGGPDRCSGLPVVRYTPEGVHAQFGQEFSAVGQDSETHRTPWGGEQEFVYCYCRMASPTSRR